MRYLTAGPAVDWRWFFGWWSNRGSQWTCPVAAYSNQYPGVSLEGCRTVSDFGYPFQSFGGRARLGTPGGTHMLDVTGV